MGRPLGGTTDYANPVVSGVLIDSAAQSQGPESSDGTTDAAAFLGAFNLFLATADFVGTIVLDKSFDGGSNWYTVTRDVLGTPAYWDFAGLAATLAMTLCEVEPNVLWRVRCSAWTAGSIDARLSQGGGLVFTAYPGMGGLV